jgi:hypothetical protein
MKSKFSQPFNGMAARFRSAAARRRAAYRGSLGGLVRPTQRPPSSNARRPANSCGLRRTQQNPLGRFQPRYELRNVMHFIERLNMFPAAETAARENAYFVDIDQISGNIGKRS